MLRHKYEEVRQERVAKYQGMNLYIKNIADDVTDDQLREEFAPFGTITSAKIMGDGAQGFMGCVCTGAADVIVCACVFVGGGVGAVWDHHQRQGHGRRCVGVWVACAGAGLV